MRRIPDALINDVRSKSDIVDTISQYMTLTKRGSNYWGVCPFHDDHDPSMSVSTERQIYKCFVCGAGGNVFTFVQKYENIGFVDAVIKTAQRINIDLSEFEQTTTQTVDPTRQKIYDAMDETQKFTEFQLFTQDGKDALEIIKKRNYDENTIREFGIGVAFGNNQIKNFLLAKGFEEDTLIAADLLRVHDDETRDVFYQRIMFPIHDPQGRVIAFSARALSNDNPVKYINTSETDVYVKGNVVYNMHRAKEAARREGYLVITEGVTDSISMSRVGVKNVVSLLGVACTPEQIRLLKQCSSNIVLAFDGDRAGIEATYAIGTKLIGAGCTVRVWYNDSGLDPDDAARIHGEKYIKDGLETPVNWLDFLMSYAIGNYGLESFDNRRRVVDFVIKGLETEDNLTQSYYIKKLAQQTGFDEAVLAQQLSHLEHKPEYQPTHKNIAIKPSIDLGVSIPERSILKQMMNSKEAAYIYRDRLGFLISDLASDFSLVLLDRYRESETIELADILSLDIHESMQQLALEIDASDVDGEYNRKSLDQNIELVENQILKLGIRHLKDEGKSKMAIDEQTDLLNKAIEQIRNKNNKGGMM